MGGDLSSAPQGKSPTFLVAALKDPIGANLDRIQVIKGWLGKNGQTQERIYDVAISGGRKIDADGRSRTPVGSTVDVANATWTNTIGAGEMITVWKDPDFDPSLRAFYYVRVIEIPTPRWTAYDAKYFGIKMPAEVPMTTTERAYTRRFGIRLDPPGAERAITPIPRAWRGTIRGLWPRCQAKRRNAREDRCFRLANHQSRRWLYANLAEAAKQGGIGWLDRELYP
jgi:Protein of unknown function (DUF3604).